MDPEMEVAERSTLELEPPLEWEVVQRRYPFTVYEYRQMVEAGIFDEDDRLELIAGEIIRMAPIGPAHAGHVNHLTELFVQRFAGRAIVAPQNSVRLDLYSEPQPDLVLLRHRPDYYTGKTPAPEDVLLVVEVGDSTAAFDRRVKRPLYARAAIPELWLLDLGAHRLTVHRGPGRDGYASEVTLGPGDSVAPAAFPEDGIDVGEIVG